MNTFRGKYNCLPGDCPNAERFFSAATQPEKVTPGNGNGVVDNAYSYLYNSENSYFFDHLAAAGLTTRGQFDETSSASQPLIPSPVGENIFLAYTYAYSFAPVDMIALNQHQFIIGAKRGVYPSSPYFFETTPPAVPSVDAASIDMKLDDGRPLTGTVRALRPATASSYWYYLAVPAASSACVTTAAENPYSAAQDDKCAISVLAGF